LFKRYVKIIYFYDEGASDTQGQILDYLKKVFGSEVLVFSFNSDFSQEPMINILLTSYKIEKFPAVVVEDQVFQGHTSVEVLMKTICKEINSIKGEMPKKCQILFKNYK